MQENLIPSNIAFKPPENGHKQSMKIVTVIGARPQFVKAAAFSRAIRVYNQGINQGSDIKDIIVHTGQHYDANMSDVFFKELSIPTPAYNLGIGSGSHAFQTGHMLIQLEAVLEQEKPNLLLVYGDTNSTLAGTLAAAKLQLPIAHVEAGLRSFNRKMPEELNRVTTDHLSNLLFCPTEQAVTNLSKEGIFRNVYNVGDIMYDAFLHFSKMANDKPSIIDKLNLQSATNNTIRYALATIHRPENTNDPKCLKSIFSALSQIDYPIILPLHPRTQKALSKYKIIPDKNLQIVPPVSYLDMCCLLKHAHLVLTDSGGLQKEAFFAQIPCITMRTETEWTETVACGWNKVVGSSNQHIQAAIHEFGATRPTSTPTLYGDGTTANQIITHLLDFTHQHQNS